MGSASSLLQDPFWWAAWWGGSSIDYSHTVWHQWCVQGKENYSSEGLKLLKMHGAQQKRNERDCCIHHAWGCVSQLIISPRGMVQHSLVCGCCKIR